MSGKIPENYEELEKLTLAQAMRVILALGRSVHGAVDVEEARQIIRYTLWGSGKKREIPSFVDGEMMRLALEDNARNRFSLARFFTNISSFLKSLPGPFQEDLLYWHPGYNEILEQYKNELTNNECLILVAGEVCAGKSSLINLLLGQTVMPIDILGCTQTIVEIKYGLSPLVVVYPKPDKQNGLSPPEQLLPESNTDIKSFIDGELRTRITEKHSDTDQSPYEKIVVNWPLHVLKEGVVIVDSPGIGDPSIITQTLMGYLRRACAFIYIIDTTSAMNRYTLCNLLMKASEANDGFDPATAIFICNRWEQIREEDSDRVLSRFLDNLRFVLPGIKRTQLYPLSVKKASMHMKYGDTVSQFEELTKGIRSMLPYTIKSKLEIYYKFAVELLKRSLYTLRMSHRAQTVTFEDMKLKYKNVELQIAILQNKSVTLLQQIKDAVKKFSWEVGYQIFTYLTSLRLSFPDLSNIRGQKWRTKVKLANCVIKETLSQQLDFWEKQNSVFNDMSQQVIQQFQKQFEVFEDQVIKIKEIFLDHEEMKIFIDGMKALMYNGEQDELRKASKGPHKYGGIGLAITSDTHLDVKNERVKRMFKYEFDTQPHTTMLEATGIFLSHLSKEKIVDVLDQVFKRFIKAIDQVGSYVPCLLASDRKLLEKLNEQLLLSEQKLAVFQDLTLKCFALQGNLDLFYADQLMRTEFSSQDIVLGEKIGAGQFASVYKSSLKTVVGDVEVAVKKPRHALTVSDVSFCLLELSVLREACHKNVVHFYGAYRRRENHELRLFLVTEYCPSTLRNRCAQERSPSSINDSDLMKHADAVRRVSDYVICISLGLAYLHHKSIVHRDIKPENILISQDNTVKITDFGLSNKAKFTMSSKTGTLPYMAPEIVSVSGKYDSKVDMYSLGMIIWELWYGKNLVEYASAEIQIPFETAMKSGWRPSITLTNTPPTLWKCLMQSCWSESPLDRPSASDVAKDIQQWLCSYLQRYDLDT